MFGVTFTFKLFDVVSEPVYSCVSFLFVNVSVFLDVPLLFTLPVEVTSLLLSLLCSAPSFKDNVTLVLSFNGSTPVAVSSPNVSFVIFCL